MHPLDVFRFCPKCGGDKFEINTPRSKKCADCGFEYFKSPTIGVGVLIFDDADRMLCIRRANDPGRGMLGLPGGFVDPGETLQAAAQREVMEEVGATIKLNELVTNIPNTYVYSGFDVSPLDFYFTARLVSGPRGNPQSGEVREVLFIPRVQINPDEFGMPSARKFLKWFLNK